MVKVNFLPTDYKRQVAGAAPLVLKNRYFEENPSLTDDGSALLARPGMRRLTSVGDGPIRGLASEPGSFGGDLFIASGANLYRMDSLLATTNPYTGLANAVTGFVNMAITAEIGTTPEYCFIADGATFLVYIANGYAHGTISGTPANTDVVRIDSVYYSFTNGSVDAGAPAGTVGNPWLVALGASTAIAWENLYDAINAGGVAGTAYSTALTGHATVLGQARTATSVIVRYRTAGAGGNSAVTTETGAAISWSSGATLINGGTPTVLQVYMPDDIGVIDVAVINSYVIVIPAQSEGYQGRFYWIEPGETTVDPLNFATAERSPDGVYGVEVFGDQFWLPGESTTEVWFPTGVATAPMRRLQGVSYDRGSWANTSQAVHESLVLVDADGGVFILKGGSPRRVSNASIEEQIRKAISAQQAQT